MKGPTEEVDKSIFQQVRFFLGFTLDSYVLC